MTGQEQIRPIRKPTGSNTDGNLDLTGDIPDISQLMVKNKKLIKKREEMPCNGGHCQWADICNFNCERKK